MRQKINSRPARGRRPHDRPHVELTERISSASGPSGAAPSPIAADLEYGSADPYAVTAVLHAGTGPVRWTFGRDLLADGQIAPRARATSPSPRHGPSWSSSCSNSPDGAAVLEAPAQELAAFLDRTYQLPAGEESACFDFERRAGQLAGPRLTLAVTHLVVAATR